MKIKLTGKITSFRDNKGRRFNHSGEIKELPEDEAAYLLAEYPEWFEVYEKDEIIDLLAREGSMPLVDIADKLGIEAWQTLIPRVKELIEDEKLTKNEDNEYEVIK